ncbi:MAG: TnpV protein [Prevotella sp.]|nr:TnpV protein [Staphylococcus sp.]MCM1350347.1 TnpV protein [Prevotella sp.]
MEKSIFEENGYFIPDLTLPIEKEKPIELWGERHLRYIKEHKWLLYVNLLINCKLNSYLADINEQAEELFFWLVKQLIGKEAITEELKSADQMTGVTQ